MESFKIEDRINAWSIIKNENFTSLPISPYHFINKYGFSLMTYEQYSKINNMTTDEISLNHDKDGFVLLEDKKYTIIFNSKMPNSRINWTIMNLVCHILLNNLNENTTMILRNPSKREDFHIKADSLAARLLCPSVVLHMCCVQSSEEISSLCNISKKAAEIRFEHLKDLRKRNKFLSSNDEQKIILQFAPFICSYLCKKFDSNSSI